MVHRIPLSNDPRYALVSDHKASLTAGYTWRLKKRADGPQYVVAYVRGSGRANQRDIYLHTLVAGRRFVDHANGDPLDCTDGNLRDATTAQNRANSGAHRGGTSRFKGVSWEARRRRWRALIMVDGHQRYLGRFTDEEVAARVYDAAALEAWGEFARLNFPRPLPLVPMADRGWVLNEQEQRWELRSDWERVHGWVTLVFLEHAGAGILASWLARHGWPELVPGLPWWHLVLLGGEADGQHVWLHPREPHPPPELSVRPQQLAVATLAGEPQAGEIVPVVYWRRFQVCGHGRACAWPYLAADTTAYPRTCGQ